MNKQQLRFKYDDLNFVILILDFAEFLENELQKHLFFKAQISSIFLSLQSINLRKTHYRKKFFTFFALLCNFNERSLKIHLKSRVEPIRSFTR